jgi:hypothetical protein
MRTIHYDNPTDLYSKSGAELMQEVEKSKITSPKPQAQEDEFHKWYNNLSLAEKYNYNEDGSAFPKDRLFMMRMAWDAARKLK